MRDLVVAESDEVGAAMRTDLRRLWTRAFGDQPWRTVAYVEAVATDPDRQRHGIGWWGVSYTHTDSGVVLDGEHGGLMVFAPAPDRVVDRTVPVTCQQRAGDAW